MDLKTSGLEYSDPPYSSSSDVKLSVNPKGDPVASPEDGYDGIAAPRSSSFERKLMLKIDARVLPILCALYFLTFLDRVNMGNAVIFNLQQDLGMDPTSNQFNTALVIFFVPNVILEIPSNIILKKLKPHIWLSGCMFVFGLVTICQGLVKNYGGLLATRFFIGLAEAGMFPGCFYIIGMWYKRPDALRRYTYFFNSTTLAGAFGGLIASGVGHMQGMRGYGAWRWLFIIEGAATCVVAILAWFLITDFPEQAKWLNEDERAWVMNRIREDQGGDPAQERPIRFRDVIDVLKDYKIALGSLMYFALLMPSYGYAYFSPTIISSYGYSPIQTQLHSVPPLALAFFLSIFVAFASDRLRHRYLFVLFFLLVAIAGLGVLMTVHTKPHVEYAALFLVAMGPYCGMPVALCWFTMNLGGHRRRAIGTALQLGFGQIAGIISTFSFLAKDKPYYRTGYALSISFSTLAAVVATCYFLACWSQNRSREKEMRNGTGDGESKTAGEGDLGRSYRYML